METEKWELKKSCGGGDWTMLVKNTTKTQLSSDSATGSHVTSAADGHHPSDMLAMGWVMMLLLRCACPATEVLHQPGSNLFTKLVDLQVQEQQESELWPKL